MTANGAGYKIKPETIKPLNFSRSTEYRHEVNDLMLKADTNPWFFADDSAEMDKYDNIFANGAARYGLTKS